ncbi:MAG: hypothetical protein Q4G35_09230 [Propionibacteriaceae bacterium]|nr:hypothetical protein [Propionibacteriaceae bacterium]
MTWHRRDGLWSLGSPVAAAAPLVHVLEARGAILEWPLDAPPDAPPHLSVTDAAEADWLWQLVGEPAHVALLTETDAEPAWNAALVVALRKVAHGLWLHTWWPTSPRDGVAPLERAAWAAEMARAVEEVADILDEEQLPDLAVVPTSTRAEFALAASGRGAGVDGTSIAEGRSPVAWQGLPHGVVDATEYPVAWVVDAAPEPELTVSVSAVGKPSALEGLAVLAALAPWTAEGALDAAGRAVLPLPITAAEAWAADWAQLRVIVGVPVDEPSEVRDAARGFAQQRRATVDALSFEAEADDDF